MLAVRRRLSVGTSHPVVVRLWQRLRGGVCAVPLNRPLLESGTGWLAVAGGLPFATFHADADNVHPNDAGHVIWATVVLDVFENEPTRSNSTSLQ